MKASFTEGPWVVHPGRAWVCPADDLDRPVCELRHPASDLPESRVRARANLIAAAPDLLKALNSVLPLVVRNGQPALDAAYAAIAKATGEPQ